MKKAIRKSNPRRAGALPAPGPAKRNPALLERMLDAANEDSFPASDPPSLVMPDVRIRAFVKRASRKLARQSGK